MSAAVLTVSQLTFYLKSLMEGDSRLQNVTVTGEISNYTLHQRSGHRYFTLKDSSAALKAVMFAGSARGLKFQPDNGMKVIVRGRITVYEVSGQYQMVVQEMQPDGLGALSLAYEQLKDRLAKEGLFDQEHKRPLPEFPERIGVITSPTGAAVQDILQITGRRWPAAEIVFCPSLVQGEEAPAQLTRAIREMNRKKACDVIIIGRGGGSLEDLWAFNDETLARTVYGSEIPVVSAVGHETDFTICDFAADLRAPTPSAAAELCTPDIGEQQYRLLRFNQYFREKAGALVDDLRQRLDSVTEGSPLEGTELLLEPRKQLLKETFERAVNAVTEKVQTNRARLELTVGNLDAMSPLRVLARGYAVVADERGQAVRTADDVKMGAILSVRLHQGTLQARVTGKEKDHHGRENEV